MGTRPNIRSVIVAAIVAVVPLVMAPRIATAQVTEDLQECDRRFEEGDFKKAAAACDRAINKYPGQVSAEGYSKRAAIYISLKDLEGGLAFLRDKAKKQYPDSPEILEQEAVILWQLGKKGDAIPVAERAVASKPSAWAAQFLIGEFYASRDPEKTAGAYEAYLQHRPSNLESKDVMPRIHAGFAYLSLARRALREEKPDEARQHYTRAVSQFEVLKRKHAKARYAEVNANNGLCAAYTGLAKFDQAITICEQIVRNPKLVDENGSVWYNLGKSYLAKKQAGRARTAATEYNRKRNNKEARGFILMGDAYFEERNWNLALENYQRAEQLLRPDQKRAAVDLAIAMGKTYRRLAKPDFDQAIAKLKKGLDADPNNAEIASELGQALLANRNDEEALAVTDRRVNSKDFSQLSKKRQLDLLEVAAKSLYNLKKTKESRARFEVAYKIDPNNVKIVAGLVSVIQAQAYQAFEKDDYKGASALLDQAADVNPKAPGLNLNRAVMAIDKGDCAVAQKHLDKLRGVQGYTLLYERLMGRTYLCIDKPNKKKAAEHYANADKEVKKVQANEIQAEIYTEWAPLMIDGGNLDDVVSKLSDAVQFSMQSQKIHEHAKRNLALALFRRGWQLLKSGKAAEAANDFERASREPKLLKGTEPLAFEFSYALALLDRGESSDAATKFKALASKGNQNSYLKSPYNKVGTTFFAAYANYRSGTPEKRAQAAKEFESLSGGASGAFAAKIKDLLASSYEYVAWDYWRSGKTSLASKTLASAAKYASGDIDRRVRNNRAVLGMNSKDISTFEALGSSPPEALVNLGILYDQAGKPKEAYEAWSRAAAKGANARDLKKWIDAKKRIYGFN